MVRIKGHTLVFCKAREVQKRKRESETGWVFM